MNLQYAAFDSIMWYAGGCILPYIDSRKST